MSRASRRSSYPDLLSLMAAPSQQDSVLYYLFRLEGVLHAMHDLWLAGPFSDNRKLRRQIGVVTGTDCMAEFSDYHGPMLELGGVICDNALAAARESRAPALLEMTIARLADVLVALGQLIEATDYGPLEQDLAREELSLLLGVGGAVEQQAMIRECLAASCALATEAVATLQGAGDLT